MADDSLSNPPSEAAVDSSTKIVKVESEVLLLIHPHVTDRVQIDFLKVEVSSRLEALGLVNGTRLAWDPCLLLPVDPAKLDEEKAKIESALSDLRGVFVGTRIIEQKPDGGNINTGEVDGKHAAMED